MTYLASLGAAHEPDLARGEWREVVVVHVPLGVLEGEGVQHLLHLQHPQGGDVEDLGLAPLEEPGSVGSSHHADLGAQGANLGGSPSVETHTLVDDALSHQVLEDRLEGTAGLGLALIVVLGEPELAQSRLQRLVLGAVAILLVGDLDDRRQLGLRNGADSLQDLVGVVDGDRPLDFLLGDLGGQLVLEGDDLPDVLLGLLETTGHGRLVGGGVAGGDQTEAVGSGARLDHDDVDPALLVAATGHHQLEHRLLEVGMGGEGNPLPLLQGDPDCAEGALEGDRTDGQSRRGAVQRHHVERDLLVDRKRGDHDVGLTAIAVGKRWAQGPVDETAGQDGLLRGTTLATEERTGDLAHGVHALFEVDGEREEVDALSHLLCCGGCHQHFGATKAGDHGSVGLSGEFAGAQDELFAADGPRYGDFGH